MPKNVVVPQPLRRLVRRVRLLKVRVRVRQVADGVEVRLVRAGLVPLRKSVAQGALVQQQVLVKQRVPDGNALVVPRAWPPLLLRQPRLNTHQQVNLPHKQLFKPHRVLRKRKQGAVVQEVVFRLLCQREPKVRQVVKARQVRVPAKQVYVRLAQPHVAHHGAKPPPLVVEPPVRRVRARPPRLMQRKLVYL